MRRGYGNYTLSVVPWLGATGAGVVPRLEIADPPTVSRFRYVRDGVVPDELVRGVTDWRNFFTLVGNYPATTDLEPIRRALWTAHKTCLDVVVTTTADIDPAPYAPLELTFLAWLAPDGGLAAGDDAGDTDPTMSRT